MVLTMQGTRTCVDDEMSSKKFGEIKGAAELASECIRGGLWFILASSDR